MRALALQAWWQLRGTAASLGPDSDSNIACAHTGSGPRRIAGSSSPPFLKRLCAGRACRAHRLCAALLDPPRRGRYARHACDSLQRGGQSHIADYCAECRGVAEGSGREHRKRILSNEVIWRAHVQPHYIKLSSVFALKQGGLWCVYAFLLPRSTDGIARLACAGARSATCSADTYSRNR